MHIGVLTDSLAVLTLAEALDHARDLGAATVEFGAGTWSPKPHIDAQALLASAEARTQLLQQVADRGLAISAINASGNQLHPDEPDADRITRDAVRLAGELGLDTVVLMSGLPAGVPGDRMPNWITTSWPPETTQMLEYQWNDVALPWWSEFADFAAAQGVTKLAVEMHGNQLVYNIPSALRLRREYLTVHHPTERSWNYVTVGRGHDAEFWASFVSALRAVGYDGALSIEHEDVEVGGADGVSEAAAVLRGALA